MLTYANNLENAKFTWKLDTSSHTLIGSWASMEPSWFWGHQAITALYWMAMDKIHSTLRLKRHIPSQVEHLLSVLQFLLASKANEDEHIVTVDCIAYRAIKMKSLTSQQWHPLHTRQAKGNNALKETSGRCIPHRNWTRIDSAMEKKCAHKVSEQCLERATQNITRSDNAHGKGVCVHKSKEVSLISLRHLNCHSLHSQK